MKKSVIIGVLAGFIYLGIEVVFTAALKNPTARLIGYSSIYMFPIGAFLGVVLGLLNEKKVIAKLPVIVQALLGAAIITGVELLTGFVLNIVFGLNLWDYSHEPLNYLGQISLPHSIGWIIISPLAFWFDDYLRKEKGAVSLLEMYKKLFTGK